VSVRRRLGQQPRSSERSQERRRDHVTSAELVLALQRSAGNRAVQSVLAPQQQLARVLDPGIVERMQGGLDALKKPDDIQVLVTAPRYGATPRVVIYLPRLPTGRLEATGAETSADARRHSPSCAWRLTRFTGREADPQRSAPERRGARSRDRRRGRRRADGSNSSRSPSASVPPWATLAYTPRQWSA